MLATNPRHRPSRELQLAGWRELKLGHWMHGLARVTLELDGMWHSYAHPADTVKNSPGFPTITDAMLDAGRRSGAAA